MIEGPVTAVRTTGIFCRKGCPARPRPGNTERLPSPAAALLAGYRACKRCRPLGADPDAGFDAALQAFSGASLPGPGAPAVHVARLDTPLGAMIAAADGRHLVLLEFADRRMLRTQFKRIRHRLACRFTADPSPVLDTVRRQLAEYFDGRRRRFQVPLRVPGTPFQSAVWEALRRIPTGRTRSYAQVAKAIGRSSAVRAVARANGDNRVAIIIPCHRVIGADGTLVGYGGGLWRKQRLLELEGAWA